MDWQTMVVFSVVFWSTFHFSNAIRDWRKEKELHRILRDMDTLSAKIDNVKNDDKIKRVK